MIIHNEIKQGSKEWYDIKNLSLRQATPVQS